MRFFRFLLRFFPFDFRRNHGRDMEQVFRDELRDPQNAGTSGRLRFWLRNLAGALHVAPREHAAMVRADIVYAFRMMRRTPGVAVLAILTLTIGIASTTAVFSLVNGVLLRPLPYEEPDRLVRFQLSYRGTVQYPQTVPHFHDFRDSGIFEGLAALADSDNLGFNLTGDHPPVRISALPVSSGFFEMLGVSPLIGRSFTRDEEDGVHRLAILSHALWQVRFGGDGNALGGTILLGAEPYEIVGVLPAGFESPIAGEIDVWVPQDLSANDRNHWDNYYVSVVGRIPDGTSVQSAQTKVDRLFGTLPDKYPGMLSDQEIRLVSLRDDMVGGTWAVLMTLLGAVVFVLLIACVNVANLMLAKGSARRRELSIRTALGSGRGRLIRQLVTESLVLAAIACVLGTGLAYGLVRMVLVSAPVIGIREEAVVFDLPVLACAAGLSILAGVVFGTIPAIQLSRVDPNRFLAENERTGDGIGSHRTRGMLVAAETALALVLLVGAGLLIQSFQGLVRVDTGIDSANVWTFAFNLPAHRYPNPSDRTALYDRYFQRLESVPGVRSAGAASILPLTGRQFLWGIRIEGAPPSVPGEPPRNAQMRVVDGNYFEAMGIDLVEGRTFTERDVEEAPAVIVVNRALVARYLGGNALNSRLLVIGQPWTIVGVVEDVLNDQRVVAEPKIYYPHSQFADNRNWVMTQVVALESGREDILTIGVRELEALDPNLVIYDVRPMQEVAMAPIARERFSTLLMSAFSVVSLVLAAVGVYGVLSYTVSRRTHEIGLRMALGADRRHVRGLVMLQGLRPVAIGGAIGIAVALPLVRVLQSQLFEVGSADLATIVTTAGVLVAAAGLACYLPARRATRIDPMTALRTG